MRLSWSDRPYPGGSLQLHLASSWVSIVRSAVGTATQVSTNPKDWMGRKAPAWGAP
jgi:hypothetical protein